MATTRERITALKRPKTEHGTAELDRLGWERYAAIRDALEPQHRGRYVMIEVDSGDWFLGETPSDALDQARAAHPGKAFCLIRVGDTAAHKLRAA